jgi:hypothetical protein
MVSPSSIDCPACGREIPLPVKDRCPHCAAWLEIEVEEDGLAVVSAQAEQSEPSPYQESGLLQADPILEDHARWRAGSIFGAISGFLGLFVMSIISYGDYASYGKAFFRQGNNALFLTIAAGFCALLFFGSIAFFVLVTRENKKYRQALLRRELEKSRQPSTSPL